MVFAGVVNIGSGIWTIECIIMIQQITNRYLEYTNNQ